MKKLWIILAVAFFGLTAQTLWASDGTNVSDDPNLDFSYTVTNSGSPVSFPLDPSGGDIVNFAEGNYTLVYNPTGKSLDIRVSVTETYTDNGDGSWNKVVDRRVEFFVDRMTDYDMDFQVRDFSRMTRYGYVYGEVARTFNLSKREIRFGGSTTITIDGDRDLQDAPLNWIAADETHKVFEYAFQPQMIEKGIEQAMIQVLETRDTCAEELNYLLLKFFEYEGCTGEFDCLQGMLSMERALVPYCAAGGVVGSFEGK
ncbi:hypothetical protein [Acanthopleuribacter pedis]|uniref:Secreted protein n=1 Tax=Acanthopleuribacter pedis TaxID=442870 RepID=A0A8J7Q2C0_9BACT|nr:hypothetical protein [Acanthopleuribacter pedis]MBO1319237.1 hypothetical protein [Acanthopleuribacter pedis]